MNNITGALYRVSKTKQDEVQPGKDGVTPSSV